MQVAPSILRQLVTAVESRFFSPPFTPMLPEMAIELWLHPTSLAPSELCMKQTDALLRRLDATYPQLPEPTNSWSILNLYWDFADWSEVLVRCE
jgi:hypothetical protein